MLSHKLQNIADHLRQGAEAGTLTRHQITDAASRIRDIADQVAEAEAADMPIDRAAERAWMRGMAQ